MTASTATRVSRRLNAHEAAFLSTAKARIVNGQKLTGEMCGADEGARICKCATHAESKVKPNSFAAMSIPTACRRHDFIGVTDRTPADSPQPKCLSIHVSNRSYTIDSTPH